MEGTTAMQDSTGDHSQAERISWRDFGPFLQRLRRRRGLSQETLANRLGCHRTYVWRLEHGRNHPSRLLLHSLGLAYTLTAEEVALLSVFKRLREYQMDELARG